MIAGREIIAGPAKPYQDWILENQHLKRRIEPLHVTGLVHFLVSTASKMISGQNASIDGSW